MIAPVPPQREHGWEIENSPWPCDSMPRPWQRGQTFGSVPGRNGGPSGDLFVITHVQESPVFKRKGDNVEVEVPLTIPEAIRGAEVEVPTLHGSKRLRVPAGTHHGTVQRLRGEGPPVLSGSGRGDLHYRFVIEMPTDLTQEQKDAVAQLSKVMNGNPRERILRAAGRT